MASSEIPFDIEGGSRIITHHPVEKHVLKWDITRFSELSRNYPVYVDFSTAAGFLQWRVSRVVNLGNMLMMSLTLLTKTKRVRVVYKSSIIGKYGTGVLEQEGNEIFDTNIEAMSKLIFNQLGVFTKKSMIAETLTFQCIMFIKGYPVTTVHAMPSCTTSTLNDLLSDFKDLLRKQEHCDFSLHVGEEAFPVHKAVLCARSPVFGKMFGNDVLENAQNHAEINDVDADAFRDFITFLYTGETKDLSWEKALNLYYVADKYDVGSLRKVCSEFLKFHLSINKVCDVLILAYRHGDEELKNVARLFAQMQSSSVKKTDAWSQLVKAHPKLALDIFN